MSFQVLGLDPQPFSHLFDLSDQQLQAMGATRRTAGSNPGYPCRVSLQDAEVGEEVILLNFAHHPVASPYRAAGPIYIRRRAPPRKLGPGELPDCVIRRLISLRAYDANHEMVSAHVAEGRRLTAVILQEFEDPAVEYLHLHNAGAGCYSCKVVRAGSFAPA